MPETEGPYLIEHDDIWYVQSNRVPGVKALGLGKRHVCGSQEMLGIAFDQEGGVLHKHGMADQVITWADTARASLVAMGYPELANELVTLTFPALPEAIADLNHCISSTGYVLQMVGRLNAIEPQTIKFPH